jgi:imidazolonepropionase-like amidohydrolase
VGGEDLAVPEGVPLLELDGVLTAGLVGCVSSAGTRDAYHESARALLAEARVADGLSPSHPDFQRALAAGITTLAIAPSPANVAGGLTAVVKADGSEFLSRGGHLALSFEDDALQADRFPTSYSGALAALERELAEPSGIWTEAAEGRLPVLLYAQERHEVQRAVEFARRHGLRGALVGAPLGGELAAQLAESGLGVVLEPLAASSPRRQLDSVLRLAEAGVPLAFRLEGLDGGTQPLRMSAARALRAGLSPELAWSALTASAAAIAGVEERVGTLAPGKDADFVLWSGDPLDLTSEVRWVFVRGERAHGGL